MPLRPRGLRHQVPLRQPEGDRQDGKDFCGRWSPTHLPGYGWEPGDEESGAQQLETAVLVRRFQDTQREDLAHYNTSEKDGR